MTPEVSFLSSFKENPLAILTIFLLAGISFALIIVTIICAVKRSRLGIAMGIVVAGVGLLTLIAGVGWRTLGRSRVDAVLTAPGLTEHDKERIREYGYAEADYPLFVGLGAGMLPLMGGIALAGLSRARMRP